MSSLHEAREVVAAVAEEDGELVFAREVRAGAWDERHDVQAVLRGLDGGITATDMRHCMLKALRIRRSETAAL